MRNHYRRIMALEDKSLAGARAETAIQQTADDIVSALTEIDETNGTTNGAEQQPQYNRQQIADRLRLARRLAAPSLT